MNKNSSRRNLKSSGSSSSTKKMTANGRKYQGEYNNLTYRPYCFRFRPDTDLDICEYLDGDKINNLTGYLRKLILADIYKDDPREKDSNGRPIELVEQYKVLKEKNAAATKLLLGTRSYATA